MQDQSSEPKHISGDIQGSRTKTNIGWDSQILCNFAFQFTTQ